MGQINSQRGTGFASTKLLHTKTMLVADNHKVTNKQVKHKTNTQHAGTSCTLVLIIKKTMEAIVATRDSCRMCSNFNSGS